MMGFLTLIFVVAYFSFDSVEGGRKGHNKETFKIHVPEVIKHHHHTRYVFIHHKDKKPKPHHHSYHYKPVKKPRAHTPKHQTHHHNSFKTSNTFKTTSHKAIHTIGDVPVAPIVVAHAPRTFSYMVRKPISFKSPYKISDFQPDIRQMRVHKHIIVKDPTVPKDNHPYDYAINFDESEEVNRDDYVYDPAYAKYYENFHKSSIPDADFRSILNGGTTTISSHKNPKTFTNVYFSTTPKTNKEIQDNDVDNYFDYEPPDDLVLDHQSASQEQPDDDDFGYGPTNEYAEHDFNKNIKNISVDETPQYLVHENFDLSEEEPINDFAAKHNKKFTKFQHVDTARYGGNNIDYYEHNFVNQNRNAIL